MSTQTNPVEALQWCHVRLGMVYQDVLLLESETVPDVLDIAENLTVELAGIVAKSLWLDDQQRDRISEEVVHWVDRIQVVLDDNEL